MANPVEVRRFLHCNYNCRGIDTLEQFYAEVFGLRTVMSSSGGDDGEPFGIYTPTRAQGRFMYDHRGGRWANSLELIEWLDPPTTGSVYPNPWNRGIQALAFSVADLDGVVAAATGLGATLVRRGDTWLLLCDPQGVALEVIAAPGPTEARYLRIVVSDIERTLAWWSQLGFVESSGLIALNGPQVWPGEGERSIVSERAVVATDDPSFGVVFTQWSGPPPTGPTYALPYHQGIYRMAMAVDNVHTAYAALMEIGVPRTPPHTFQLPGTPLTDGLTILFIRDPDGILVELVDRPRQGQRPLT